MGPAAPPWVSSSVEVRLIGPTRCRPPNTSRHPSASSMRAPVPACVRKRQRSRLAPDKSVTDAGGEVVALSCPPGAPARPRLQTEPRPASQRVGRGLQGPSCRAQFGPAGAQQARQDRRSNNKHPQPERKSPGALVQRALPASAGSNCGLLIPEDGTAILVVVAVRRPQNGAQNKTPEKGLPMFDTQVRDAVRQIVGPWWAFLVAGIAWFVISFVVLQMSLTSVRAVGVLLGVIFLYRPSKSSWPHPSLVVGAGTGAPWHPFFHRGHMVLHRPRRYVRVHC